MGSAQDTSEFKSLGATGCSSDTGLPPKNIVHSLPLGAMIFDPPFMLDPRNNPAVYGTSDDDHDVAPVAPSPPSASIPLPSSHVARTQSELQLALDQEVAEHRDAAMFYRLVNGIRARQRNDDAAANLANPSLASIIQTHMSDVPTSRNALQVKGVPDVSRLETNRILPTRVPTHPLAAPLGNVVDNQDDGWAIGGFEADGGGVHAAIQEESNGFLEEDQADDEHEGVFEFEL